MLCYPCFQIPKQIDIKEEKDEEVSQIKTDGRILINSLADWTRVRCSIPGTTGRESALAASTTARGCSSPRSWPARCWRGGSPWCPSISFCAPCPGTRNRNICEHGGPFQPEGPSFCRIPPAIMQNVKIQESYLLNKTNKNT